ncbi:MAG: arabinogalactan endo-beta-1,4-galactanase [Candidatus Cryptobacteroides sp.]
MKQIYTALLLLAGAITAVSCSSCSRQETSGTTQEEPAAIDRTAFAKGADISWVTEMEAGGIKFQNSEGKVTECTALMKEIGFNSVRYRVWVNPEAGWNSKEDVLAKALRAQKLGMRIMIDFHFSDTWADPGSQTVPKAWEGYDINGLVKAVSGHTTEVLSLLKKYGIEVEWVQAGNETRTGMLWPLGSYQENGGKNYANLTNACYDAAKAVYPDCKVIVHLDGGHDISLYDRLFPVLNANGGKYDIIGMSLYPCWWNDETSSFGTEWKDRTDQCIANIRTLASKYGKDVMICEVGMPACNPEIGRDMLGYLLEKTTAIEECKGVFYWEPEAPEGYNGGYGLGAFKDGKPTVALDPFRN